MFDYIFCPFCGGNKWLTDKTGKSHNGNLTSHKCGACSNFAYSNNTYKVDHPILFGISKTDRYGVYAIIGEYQIEVDYYGITTVISYHKTDEVILSLSKAVTFNWYKHEELIPKIKKYIMLS